MQPFDLQSYDLHVPEELIAAVPTRERGDSRLLVLDRATGAIEHRMFTDLPRLLKPQDRLIANDTRVLPCRIELRLKPAAQDGVTREGLLMPLSDAELRQLELPPQWQARYATGEFGAGGTSSLWSLLIRGCRPGEPLGFEELICEAVTRLPDGGLLLAIPLSQAAVRERLQARGMMPLPPYILGKRHKTQADAADVDRQRYQTVFAGDRQQSVAAPTAGLHFTPALIEQLRCMGVDFQTVTLHVGRATFQPVTVDDIRDHRMGSEWYEVPEKIFAALQNPPPGRTIAVGTTSVRALESALANGTPQGWTQLFLYPGRPLNAIDGLITNFHLPRSSLLMLVMAFAGIEPVRAAYDEAVRQRYRFFSYGDAMLIV